MADLLDEPNLKGGINLHKVSPGVRCNPGMLSRLWLPSSSCCRCINNLQQVHECRVFVHASTAAVCQPDESKGGGHTLLAPPRLCPCRSMAVNWQALFKMFRPRSFTLSYCAISMLLLIINYAAIRKKVWEKDSNEVPPPPQKKFFCHGN